MNMICFYRQLKGSPYDLFGSPPIADMHQVDAEVVISDHGIQNMLGLVKELDRLFKTFDSFLRLAQEPVRTGHVGIHLSEHERRRAVADYLDAQFEVLQRPFAVALLMIAERYLAIGFGHA